MDKAKAKIELTKAKDYLSDESGKYKTMQHKDSKFLIKVLDVYIEETDKDNDYEIWVKSQHLSTDEQKDMLYTTLLLYYQPYIKPNLS